MTRRAEADTDGFRTAMYWSKTENGGVRCELCPHRCFISEHAAEVNRKSAAGACCESAAGVCGVRVNNGGVLFASGYGQVSSTALDPIEKKPLYMFHPGKYILSVGGYGCNLRCPFCQNHEISMEYGSVWQGEKGGLNSSDAGVTPGDIAALAVKTVPNGNIGVAYTYNEPLINYEFLYDCAELVRAAGMKNVIVTNGYINNEPLQNLLPLIDAMNIDLKGFTDDFYKKVGGTLEAVKETIAASRALCHVEVTTLVIPGENEDDVMELSKWLASVDADIPLHLTRFFPRYKYGDRQPTPRETIYKLRDIAKEHLRNVFTGNM